MKCLLSASVALLLCLSGCASAHNTTQPAHQDQVQSEQAAVLTYQFTVLLQRHAAEGEERYEGEITIEELVQAQAEYYDREVLVLHFEAKPGETFRHVSTVGPPEEALVVELALPSQPGEPAECVIEISRGKTRVAYLVTQVENGSTQVVRRDSPLQLSR